MLVSYLYCLPYVLAFIILFTICIREINIKNNREANNIKIRFACCSFYLFFIGLRGFIHTDWIEYYPFFEDLPTLWNLQDFYWEDFLMEPGFIIYSLIIKSIFPSYYVWVFISTLIDIIIIDSLLKKNIRYYALGFLFFYSFYTMYEINLLRNNKSIMLFFLSINYVKNNDFKRYLILNFIGFLFHTSALVYILIYPLLKIRIPKFLLYGLFVVGMILYLGHIAWIGDILILLGEKSGLNRAYVLIRYVENSGAENISIGFFERIFTYLFFLYHRDKIWSYSRYSAIVYNCYVLYFISSFYLSEIGVLTDRISTLFILSYCFIYPVIFERVKKNKSLFLLCIFSYMLAKEIQGHREILTRYSNVIFGVESYEKRFNEAVKSKPYLEERYIK